MKVRYIGDSYRISLTKGKIYDVLSIEEGMYRIVDDTEEDYLFSSDDFEPLPDGEFDRPLPDILSSLTLTDLKKLHAALMKFSFSDEEYAAIEEKISEYLQMHGFDGKYAPTEAGRMCESILDLLSVQKRAAAVEVKLYDRVLLTDGNPATIVEIFEDGKFFLADIDKDGDTYTEDVSIEEISKVLQHYL